jgi:ABC-type nitrate/sulfonate/bicarbonate transport system permease component
MYVKQSGTPLATAGGPTAAGGRGGPSRSAILLYRWRRALREPTPYLMLVGLTLWFASYYLFTEGWELPRFEKLPGPVEVVTEWFSPDPVWGVSIYTEEYYRHILASCTRILIGFCIATTLGVSVGLMMGWSRVFKDYTFPILETLRPIPILAWVPLAILMFSGTETPVIFLTTLASFYVTVLNTLLGVESIDKSYFRAAACLGSKRHHIFWHVVVPGAMPYIFTGLQISMGVAWFSLVAAEMVSGEFGLGYLIVTSYVNVTYVTIVIGMVTLGIIGYITSAMIRKTGDILMEWRVRTLGGR